MDRVSINEDGDLEYRDWIIFPDIWPVMVATADGNHISLDIDTPGKDVLVIITRFDGDSYDCVSDGCKIYEVYRGNGRSHIIISDGDNLSNYHIKETIKFRNEMNDIRTLITHYFDMEEDNGN
jgi:hypothetical protein